MGLAHKVRAREEMELTITIPLKKVDGGRRRGRVIYSVTRARFFVGILFVSMELSDERLRPPPLYITSLRTVSEVNCFERRFDYNILAISHSQCARIIVDCIAA
jgi:hypothetical protein